MLPTPPNLCTETRIIQNFNKYSPVETIGFPLSASSRVQAMAHVVPFVAWIPQYNTRCKFLTDNKHHPKLVQEYSTRWVAIGKVLALYWGNTPRAERRERLAGEKKEKARERWEGGERGRPVETTGRASLLRLSILPKNRRNRQARGGGVGWPSP